MSPNIQTSDISFSDIKSNSINVSWTNGDGDGRILVVSTELMTSEVPVDGISYNAQGRYGKGSNLLKQELSPSPSPSPSYTGLTSSSNAYVVYDGSGNNFTVMGLDDSTDYWFSLFEYNYGYNYLIYPMVQRTIVTSVKVQTSSFDIEVLDEISKNGIEGAIIEVLNRNGNIVDYGETNSVGKYTSNRLEIGGYTIRVSRNTYSTTSLGGVYIKRTPPDRKDNSYSWTTVGMKDYSTSTDPRLVRRNNYKVVLKRNNI